jgi:hypothetical protein
MDVFRSALEELPERRVLILGATPELVEMALELDAERVLAIDRWAVVGDAMHQLRSRDWDQVELVSGDWLEDRPELHSSFTYVASDGGPLFLTYPDEWERLFPLVRRYLEPGGRFVAKCWAQSPGSPSYEELVPQLIAEFEGGTRTKDEFRRLLSELRVAAFLGGVRPDGSFDQELQIERLDSLLSELEARFPDPEQVEISRAALLHIARSRPGTTDIVTGVEFDRAERLLRESGFTDCRHFPLPDPPVPNSSYMWVAA